MNSIKACTIVGLLLSAVGLSAGDFYVSPTGDNADDGSQATPWLTVGYALTQAQPGDIVHLRAGEYPERVVMTQSGQADAYITLRAYDDEEAVIDGTGQTVSGRQGLVEIQGCSYVRLEGLTIRHFSTSSRDQVPVGILYVGSGTGVEIVGNTVEQIASTATPRANKLGRDAHGIAVFGTETTLISELLIMENTVRDLTLGSSEAMVLNGNIDGFRILNNVVQDCDNIGIDCIGFEGTGPSDALDQARNGWICGNRVSGITAVSNPSYTEPSAGGIYVDGGRDIVIERNEVANCDIGIEVASEHAGKATSNIIVRSNLLRGCLMAGLFIGGYEEGTTGSAENCLITHNTFYNNDTQASSDEYGQLHLQYEVRDTQILGNIFYHSITKSGEYNLFIVQWNNTDSGLTIDRNLYYGPDTPVWVLGDDWIEGWSDYDALSLSGSSEAWGDPRFADPENGDFGLESDSPAIDMGSSDDEAGVRDLPGNNRQEGASLDAGAIEFGAASGEFGALDISAIGQEAVLSLSLAPGWIGALESSDDLSRWQLMPGQVIGSIASGTEASLGLAWMDSRSRFYKLTVF